MPKTKDAKITYPDLIKAYYERNLQDDLGLSAHSMCHFLMLKANALHFRSQKLAIPNSIMAIKSALSISTMKRARKRLTAYKIDGKQLVEYEAGTRHRSGIYTFHFELLCPWCISEVNLTRKEEMGDALRVNLTRKAYPIENEEIEDICQVNLTHKASSIEENDETRHISEVKLTHKEEMGEKNRVPLAGQIDLIYNNKEQIHPDHVNSNIGQGCSISKYTLLKLLIKDRWNGTVNLSDADCGYILSFTDEKWPKNIWHEDKGRGWQIRDGATAITFWEDVVDKMTAQPASIRARSIRKMGEKMWATWKKDHMQHFF